MIFYEWMEWPKKLRRVWASPPLITGRRVLYLGVLLHVLVGLLHLGSSVEHLNHPARYVFEGVILLGFPTCLVALVRFVATLEPCDDDYWRLILWAISGTSMMLLTVALFLVDLALGGFVLPHPGFILITAADIGALFGVVAGTQEVRVRKSVRRAERAETRAILSAKHRQSLRFLNRMLRHHVLNGLSITLGLTEQLNRTARDDQMEALDKITGWSEEMAMYVEDINTAVTALSDEIEVTELDLSHLLARQSRTASETFPGAQIQVGIPSDVSVRGAALLDRAFEHLIENAIVHNDAETPRVRVEVRELEQTVRVSVSDNGPGMSETDKVAYFQRGEHGEKSLGEGLGLYFAESVVSLCGGDIWIEDNDPRGTRVQIELPKSPS